MKVQKMNHPNEGIKCVVNTCHYYMNGDYCAAEKVEIQREMQWIPTRQTVQRLFRMLRDNGNLVQE